MPGKSLQLAYRQRLLVSQSQLDELDDVLSRDKFQRCFTPDQVAAFQARLLLKAQFIEVTTPISDCRDVKDNHILALAWDGKADLVVTGDKDLLVLTLGGASPF